MYSHSKYSRAGNRNDYRNITIADTSSSLTPYRHAGGTSSYNSYSGHYVTSQHTTPRYSSRRSYDTMTKYTSHSPVRRNVLDLTNVDTSSSPTSSHSSRSPSNATSNQKIIGIARSSRLSRYGDQY